MTNGRINKRSALLAILCVLVMVFAVPVASAASYSKVYGQTQDKVRVRESASTNATIIDNIVKDACIYITSSKTSGSNTFVQVKYRASDGSTATGWVCQSDGRNTYVKVLSTDQAKSKFKVSSGDLPSKAVGTFTAAERKASAANSDTTYIRENSSGATVSKVQTELKALGYYSGKVTGNAGPKTVAAIKSFQGKNGLTADGIAGPQTIAKIDAAYEAKGGSSSGSGSSASGLKLNSKGTDVRNLQQDLTTLGYYWAKITGNFGEKTEAAVKRFQEENGLTADGVAGTKTLNAIAAAVARKGGTPASGGNAGTTLKLNSQGTKVSQLQTDLKQLGYYYAKITGNFGAKTEAAVKAFQKAKGLTADGVAGTKTLDAIAVAVDKAGGSSSGSSSTNMKLGSTGTAVSALQQNLTTLGYYYGDITGHYGNLTQQAVKKFQKAKGLTQDGVASTATLNAITSALKNAGVDVGPGTVATTLREGDRGTAVTELQTMLKKLNYYYGSITGSFGSLTKQAVRKFQDANKLTVDGVAGPATINKLRSLTGGSADSGSSGGSTVTTDKSYGKITKDNVYLRSSYSTSSSAKASLSSGKLVRITKTYTVGGVKWYYITVNIGSYTYNGYVRSDMMTTISEAEYNKEGGDSDNSAGDQETIGMIKVTGNNVSLRYQPSTSANRVGTANIGDCFYYVDTVDGWFQTRSGYWISRSYAAVMTDEEVKAYIKNNGGSGNTGSNYTLGSTGSTVSYIQTALTALEYYDRQITGHYGRYTKDAVRAFQRDNNLTADGVCGAATLAAIQKAYSGSSSATTTYNDTFYDLNNWFTDKARMNALGLKRDAHCKMTDLRTGKSLNIYIQSTGNHADVEPLTAADTTTLCEIYGVSSADKIGWEARPILITVDKYQFICSIYGEAHGAEVIKDNNYSGQFCLHFTGSKTHNSGETLDRHKKAIAEAATILTKMGKKLQKGTP